MIEGVEHVSNLITRYTILEAIYVDTLREARTAAYEQLQSALTKLYATILTYLTKASRYYDKNTIGAYFIFLAIHIRHLHGWILRSYRTHSKRSHQTLPVKRGIISQENRRRSSRC
jgi:hypothetical protein